jgi:hypothetical protein
VPENEVAQMLGVNLDPSTKGAVVDQTLMTSIPGIFSCGNALHVNDLVDYVSKSGEDAGKSAAEYCKKITDNGKKIPVEYDKSKFLYVVPQYYNVDKGTPMTLYFRARSEFKNQRVCAVSDAGELINKKFRNLTPSEMEVLSFKENIKPVNGKITVTMEGC